MASQKRYIGEMWDMNDRVDIDVIPMQKVADHSRQKKYKPTTEAQKNCNWHNSMRYFIRLVHINFTANDWSVCLDYENGWYPDTEEDGLNDIKNYIRRLRYLYAKHGVELKAVYVTARGEESGRLHHHMIVNACDGVKRKDLIALWKKGKRMTADRLEMSQLGCADLSAYMARQPDVTTRRWTCTKNLKKPEKKEYLKPGDSYHRHFTKADCEDFFKHNFTKAELIKMFPGLHLSEEYQVTYNVVNGEYYLHFRFYKENARIAWWGKAFDDESPLHTYDYLDQDLKDWWRDDQGGSLPIGQARDENTFRRGKRAKAKR